MISVHWPTRRQVPPVLKSIFKFRTLTLICGFFYRIIASGVRRISRSFYGGSGESLNRSRGESPNSGNQNPRSPGSPGGNKTPRVGSPGGSPTISGNQRSASFVEAFPRRKKAPMANQNHNFASSNQELQKQMEKSNNAVPVPVPVAAAASPQSDGDEMPSPLATHSELKSLTIYYIDLHAVGSDAVWASEFGPSELSEPKKVNATSSKGRGKKHASFFIFAARWCQK